MTTPVCARRRIRQLDRQGLSHREISRRLGVSRTTVVRYANHGDYSPESSDGARAGGSLVDDGYAAVVDGWPAAGLRMPVKRRRAAARGYERLVGECGFTGPYSSVQRRVRRWRRGIERGRTASPNRSGRREARRSISAEPGPWSLAWSGSCVSRRCRSRVRTCAGWRRCRARPRNACAGVCRRCSRGRAWRPGSWCSTTPSAWATATPTARPPGPVCSPCSARATGSGPGSATRIPATGRAAWRTRSAFAGRDPMVPMPSAEGFRASVRVWLDDIRVVAAECGFAATVKAVETVIDAGRTIDRAAIATCARRVLEGKGSSGGQDLKHHDEYMEGRA